MNVHKKWIVENGEGHWLVWNDYGDSESCDDSELTETIWELSIR